MAFSDSAYRRRKEDRVSDKDRIISDNTSAIILQLKKKKKKKITALFQHTEYNKGEM